ncbi:hypothetical protein KL938_003368 [Ogataea parapolymorpha]|nr:hypothetical protein KL938_003368 [Ogataea parapolymorpha]
MSMPTPATNLTPSGPLPGSSGLSTPMTETIAIQDLENGKLDIDSIILEIQELRSHISGLRYEMARYIRLLASIDEDTTSSVFYQEVATQINLLKSNLDSYQNAYKRLLPVVRYAKLKMGANPEDQIKVEPHEVKIETKFLNEQSLNKIESTKNPLISSIEMGGPPSSGSVGSPGMKNSAAKRPPSKAKPAAKKK